MPDVEQLLLKPLSSHQCIKKKYQNESQSGSFNYKSQDQLSIQRVNLPLKRKICGWNRHKKSQRVGARGPPLQLGPDGEQLQWRSYFYFSNVLRGDAVINKECREVVKLRKVGEKVMEFEKINPTLRDIQQIRSQIIKYLFGRFHKWVFELPDSHILDIYHKIVKERKFLERKDHKHKCLNQQQEHINPTSSRKSPSDSLRVREVVQIDSSDSQEDPSDNILKSSQPQIVYKSPATELWAYQAENPNKKRRANKKSPIRFFTFAQQGSGSGSVALDRKRESQESMQSQSSGPTELMHSRLNGRGGY